MTEARAVSKIHFFDHSGLFRISGFELRIFPTYWT